MIDRSFASGNYNSWEKFTRETLPQKTDVVKLKLVPSIDQILESMLGEFSNIHKISADITPVFDEYIRIGVSLVYEVEDFKAPDVPIKAVEADTQAIKNSLEEQLKEDEVSIESVKINTSSGELAIKANIAVKF